MNFRVIRKQAAGRLLASLALSLCALVSGCGAQKTPKPIAATIATSRDGALSYAVDAASDVLTIHQKKPPKKLAEVHVGKAPESVIVAPDDTIYVANRGSRSVSVIRRGEWKEASRIQAGVEPVALAIASDNRTLYVLNGSSFDQADKGTLMAVDLSSRDIRWELPISGQPRSMALIDSDRARIELYKQDQPLWVNLNSPWG